MIVLVAPEPLPWVRTVLSRMPGARLFAPKVARVGAWALRGLWARDRTARRMRLRFIHRRLVDLTAAQWLPRQARVVVAPSCGAEAVFAVAKSRGCETVLVHDLPCLRELHAHLDEAARHHPGSVFLRRFRAARAVVVRQEVERVLADRLLVKGAYASDLLGARGVASGRIERLDADRRASHPRRPMSARPVLLLAGLAAARGGTHETLAALEGRPHLTLLVRPGEGTEPSSLLAHPRVRIASRSALERLEGVDAVLAPAWCETYPREVPLAIERAVPIIGTLRAVAREQATHVVDAGDASGLGAALDALCPGKAATRARE